MANELRTRDGLPFNFVDGLRIKGVDVTNWDKVFIDQGASYVGFQPVGNLAASNVQAAIAELESEKQSKTEPIATAINLRPGANQGVVWDIDAFGGGGDSASITLETAGGEATKMRFKMTNDLDDSFEFTAKSGDGLTDYNNAMTLNGNVLLNAANYVDYTAPMISDYVALRAYTGSASQVRITANGIAGFFYRDDADTTSTDNGGTVVVSGDGRRWKRIYSGLADVRWFGAKSIEEAPSFDSTSAIQSAINSVNSIFFPIGSYKVTSTISIGSSGKTIIGGSYASSWSGGETNKVTLVHSFNGDMFVVSGGRHVIDGIQFKSDGAYTGVAISISALQVKVIKSSFYRLGGGAIKITGLSYGTYIEDNTFDACGVLGNYDIYGNVTGPSVSDYNTITHIEKNIFENSYVGAVSLKDSDPFYISKNYIEPYNSTTISAQILIQNSSSGNSKGWIKENYIGSLSGTNGYAIIAMGANISIESNDCNYFQRGIYIETQNGVVANNKVLGFTSEGVNISSSAAGVNNNVVCSGNVLQARSIGSAHGILLRGFVNNVDVFGNVINGKCDYYIRLLACSRCLVSSNTIAPYSGESPFGIGVYEDATNTSDNAVKSNQIVAAIPLNRSSFDYDVLFRSAAPTTGTWKLNNIVWNSSPVAGGVPGWVCVTAGTPGTWKSMAALSA